MLSLDRDHQLQTFLESSFALTHPAFSHDGRWLAYVSNESGRNEVYVQAYPGPGDKHRLSTAGGTGPTWTSGGREVLYVQPTSPQTAATMMVVDVDTTRGFSAGRPRPLLSWPYSGGGGGGPTRGFDVSADGQRFIVVKPVGEPETPPNTIEIVLNWTEELKARAPAK
jgi:hypothetical protein